MNDTTRAHATLLRRWYLFIGLLLLVACGTPAAQSVAPPSVASPTPDATATPVPSPLPTPTPVPTATPEPRLAEGVYIAGIEVGGLTPTEARRELTARLAPLLRPLDIRAGDQELAAACRRYRYAPGSRCHDRRRARGVGWRGASPCRWSTMKQNCAKRWQR
jgi:hypothetical protein